MKKFFMLCIGQLIGFLFWPFKGAVKARQDRIVKKYLNDPSSVSDIDAHTILNDLAWIEYEAGNLQAAEKYSLELLRLNRVVESNWNSGNAIHHAHTILGLLRLDEGSISLARDHLVKSSKTQGSPQLDSFGPRFILAQRMIELGEKESCEKFLKNCKKFWDMDGGRVSSWLRQIEKGETPKMYEYQ